MLKTSIQEKILQSFPLKEDRFFISSILDKVNNLSYIECLGFMNGYEFDICVNTLEKLNVNYVVFSLNQILERRVIFLVPDYLDNVNFEEYICCVKLNCNQKLMHKDYLGAIMNLGVKSSLFGDIFVKDNSAYIFCQRSIVEYVLNNFTHVSRYKIILDTLELNSSEINDIEICYVEKKYIVNSLRADLILSQVFKLSRLAVKEKVDSKELYINDRVVSNSSVLLKENDIVAFRKCGKFKLGEVISKTKKDNFVILIYIYSS